MWLHKPVLGPAAKQTHDWMRGWVVGRRGDLPGLPLGEQVALSLMPTARETGRRDLPDGDLSEREWPDADEEDDDGQEREHRDGDPSSFMQGRLHPQGGH